MLVSKPKEYNLIEGDQVVLDKKIYVVRTRRLNLDKNIWVVFLDKMGSMAE